MNDASAAPLLVSVVVCSHTHERFEDVLEATESVLEGTYEPVEVVVVSDGNRALAQRLRAAFDDDRVRVVLNEGDGGLSASRNVGIDHAEGDVVAFLDDDAVADEEWLERLVNAYETEDVVAAGGRMTGIWIGGEPDFLPEEFYWLVGVTHRGFPESEGYVRNTFGSNISFRRDVLEALGGFSADVGLTGDTQVQGDETELAARLRREYGQGVYYVPDAVVEHKVFDYRTDPVWLARRAFWQGYSKRAMETLVTDSTGVEGEFLGKLLVEFVPSRLTDFVRSPSFARVQQLVALFVLTALVGAGYLYGFTRYR